MAETMFKIIQEKTYQQRMNALTRAEAKREGCQSSTMVRRPPSPTDGSSGRIGPERPCQTIQRGGRCADYCCHSGVYGLSGQPTGLQLHAGHVKIPGDALDHELDL